MCHRLELQDVHLLGHDNCISLLALVGFIFGKIRLFFLLVQQGLYDGRLESFVRLCTIFQHSSMCLELQGKILTLFK